MKIFMLHHVSIVTCNLDRATEFYRDVFGLQQVARPPFKIAGAWFNSGGLEIHLVANTSGTFRAKSTIDTGDSHFAIRVEDFEAAVSRLVAKGFREDAAEDDPLRLIVNRKRVAGYPHAYLLDPDRNIVEINAAP